jgi:hypothetical protein
MQANQPHRLFSVSSASLLLTAFGCFIGCSLTLNIQLFGKESETICKQADEELSMR